MSFAALTPTTRTVQVNGGEIVMRPLTVSDLQYVWTARGSEIRATLDPLLNDPKNIPDAGVIMEMVISQMPDVIYDLLLLANGQDPSDEAERTAIKGLATGTIIQLATVAYELAMIDSDDLKKTLAGVLKKMGQEKLSPTQLKMLQQATNTAP